MESAIPGTEVRILIQQSKFILLAQQLAKLAGGVWGERSGSVETVRAEMDALAAQAGLDLGLAHRLTPESLGLLVAPGGATDPTRCWLLAELFYIDGRLSEREGSDGSARKSYARALFLYRRVDPGRLPEADIPAVAERVEELGRRLDAG